MDDLTTIPAADVEAELDVHLLTHDVETRSTVDLADVGTAIYAKHPTTEVMCIAYCVDEQPMKIWHPGEPVPKEFILAAKHPKKWKLVAHGASFERNINREILHPRHGFPLFPIEQYICTMAMANANALPASLDKLGKVINLKYRKDSAGARVMLQMAKPRRARKKEDHTKVYWYDDPERRQRLDTYCALDVEATREIVYSIPWLSPEEHEVWVLDQVINDTGFHLDLKLINAARKITAAAHPRINAELTKLTNGQVTAFTQVAKLKEWLEPHCGPVDLDKSSMTDLLDSDLPEHVRRVIELRYLGAQAAVSKVDALLQRREKDGRLRHAFVYHAAGPGRWSSRGAQVHNLKRSMTEDIEKAVKIIGRGDFEYARQHYDNPLSVIGDLIRAMVDAEPNHVLIGADFSGIEARVTAWLASEHSKLDVFRAYDAGKGPDPYIVAAAKIFGIPAEQIAEAYKRGDPHAREMRQIGKACELAFGYQGGVNAFRRFTPSGGAALTISQAQWQQGGGRGTNSTSGDQEKNRIETDDLSDRQIDKIKYAWRRAHPNIEQLWHNLNTAAWRAVRMHHETFTIVKSGLKLMCDDQPFLWMTLPSGRKLAYPHARIANVFTPPGTKIVIEVAKGGGPALLFKDSANGQWRDVRAYGGILTENAVQAVARDLLAAAMLRVHAAGFKIVAHIHDECIIEVHKRDVERVKPIFEKLMMQLPSWAEGLPVVAKAWNATRYVK